MGISHVNRSRRPLSVARALLVMGAAALLLAACGRKGPLDLPANSPPAPQMSAAPADTATEAANKPGLFNSGYGADAAPAATRGQKKPFILDPLLDSK
ncbi:MULTISPECIES: LPS translocon maturation chaperone LptM [unclassified Bradyrhizobium]|uniref:LPS translocon maturation chaperone LptM n=1 Tax=unclassified Bradyrhizobium TaxID=2631580 RepID=UPI0028E77556|nr:MULTISPECIES: lipoprotein [unclassified Bradyrhizobium]